MIITTREERRKLARANARLSDVLQIIPFEDLPPSNDERRIKVWRSKSFLVQAFQEKDGVLRLSVNRTMIGEAGRWEENITWEELMKLKREAGYGDKYSIEVYPRDKDIVNVANMRHLWILDNPLNIGWFKS